PQNTCTFFGCPEKCGWWYSTTDISQLESCKDTRPPVPALLPENDSIWSKKRVSRQVTVKDSHQDSGIEALNAAGLPNAGRPLAIFSHSAQPSLSVLVRCVGGSVIEPR